MTTTIDLAEVALALSEGFGARYDASRVGGRSVMATALSTQRLIFSYFISVASVNSVAVGEASMIVQNPLTASAHMRNAERDGSLRV
jgi:hypothetical protein